MLTNLSSLKECLVYPGVYVPLPEIEALAKEIKTNGKDSIVKPLVNMDEQKDCYKIEVALPGILREDIFINVYGNDLTVIVFHKNSNELKEKLPNHEFDTDFLVRHLLLPEMADTEFICATYQSGILSLFIPKNPVPHPNRLNQIVVY
jgi:HSP20 family molecular chaperone IbpA